MLATKNRICRGAIIFFALAVFVAGCAPPGPRALLKGKKFLDHGDYADAVAQLKIATSILATNAEAWNYLGVAEQHAGQSADAVLAYQRALTLDRDLDEAHYNLGCLWLEQNKLDTAKSEFTAYTLRRNNAPDGWLKLGLTELRARDLAAADKSFSTVLALEPNNAEALNGLGLSQIQRGRPREAAQYFSTAVKAHPDYAPAILNLATVADEYLHDRALALQNYRAYLTLTPRPANWDEVNALVNSWEQKQAVVEFKPPPDTGASVKKPVEMAARQGQSETRPKESNRPVASPSPPPAEKPYSNPPSSATSPAEVVQVQPEPALKTSPTVQETNPQSPPVIAEAPPSPQPEARKPGFWHKVNPVNWFRSSKSENFDDQVTPLPPPDAENDRVISSPPPKSNAVSNSSPAASQPVVVAVSKPIHIVQPAPPTFPRYLYLSPHPPRAGDRKAAVRAFAEAQKFEQEQKLEQAMKSYQHAARLDPGWFEAQYNYGVLAYRLRDFDHSLAAYEMALAIQPDSIDARYNFALTLKAAGYALDAVDELKKILVANPDEVRAHLALANLYAQQLRDYAQAREHYLKVLQLDPVNPQATDIRFWLSSNPP